MRAKDIQAGDMLSLKRERQDAYDKTSPVVRVDEVVYRKHYKTPFIRQEDEYYVPSDFARHVPSHSQQQEGR